MRFYDLTITKPAQKKNGKTIPAATTLHLTSYPGGANRNTTGPSVFGVTPLGLGIPGFNQTPYDPQALNVVFDIVEYPMALTMGNSWITVEGVPQKLLTNAQNFAGQYLEFRGGMGSNGLPLANPKQIGLLAAGNVYQVFGNLKGTQVDITFVVQGSTYTIANPGNIALTWPAGVPLTTALREALQVAYPECTINMSIAPTVLPFSEWHVCPTLGGLAKFINSVTPTHVEIVILGTVITVFDTSYKPPPKLLEFTDFVGQVQWIDQNSVQIQTVLRGDIHTGDYLLMPLGFSNAPGFVQTHAASLPSSGNYKSAIQGVFQANHGIRHVGNFRQPNGNAWISIINAVYTPTTEPVT